LIGVVFTDDFMKKSGAKITWFSKKKRNHQ